MSWVPLAEQQLDDGRSIPNQLYDILRGAILEGSLRPGERLIEQVVANTYAISRTPVREVLHRLSADGYIEQGERGLVVALVEPGDVVEILAVRQTLERMAAGLAARYRTELEATRLRHIREQLEVATERADAAELRRLARRLHRLVGEASRNQYLARLLAELQDLFDRSQGSAVGGQRRQLDALAEHLAMIDSILDRDVAEAERAAGLHWRRVVDARSRMLLASEEP